MKKYLKSICSLVAMSAMVFSLAGCGSSSDTSETNSNETSENTENTDSEMKKIGILQLVEHDALDNTREGFIAALAEEGFVEGENIEIDIQNAQNDQSNLKTMSQKFVNDGVDLIFAIATPAAQSAATETTEIPIIGSAITDYVEAGLVDSNEAPGGNVTGTSDKTPVKEQFDLLKEILPDVETVGILYNSSEVNSEIQAGYAKEAAEALGMKYEMGTVTSTNDISQVVQSIVGKVDAIYVPTDNTFASAMPLVASVTDTSKTPVICGENGMVSGGGLATLGIDYYKLGEQTGKMAAKILNGEDPATMPVEFSDVQDICVNLDTAKTIGVTIPDSVMEKAVIVIENGEKTTK
ncbi:sugar ABC transporter substrate-binding protein [Tyzzerella sp. An114]|uniref:ABC transporter substrate-binding protein n=1 Tax=Tyzzerella sp. An114 TaxID=1965545 RepID=UPI000B449A60|nr:ABC transporter substrate-binding protein [Tyzzerella sp. An114]OUQ59171.1 sugar ABC transporter substrate-binding protein [Tyzzerella sp. An114]